jgi:hypothetical protein
MKFLKLFLLISAVLALEGCGGGGESSTSTPTRTNTAPVANAGNQQNLITGSIVTLDGSRSTDAEQDALTYSWSLTDKPTGSSATLSSATSAHPTFTADVEGAYVASLTVNDGQLRSITATVSVTAVAPATATSGSLNGWVALRTVSVLDGTVSCSLSKEIGRSTSFGIRASFMISALSFKPGSRSGFAPFPQDDIEAPYFTVSYCSEVSCYGTNSGSSLLKVDNFATRQFSGLADATLKAHQAAFLARGQRILTTDQSPDRYQGLLDELSSGSSILVRAVPNNPYFPTIEGTADLKGYAEMLAVFNRCSAGRPNGPP